MSLVKLNIVEEGLARLPFVWNDKHNVQGLVKSLLQQVQELEDVFHQLNEERDIFSAVGKQLDALGLIIGESRKSRGDDEYRVALLVQIAINNSSGTHDALLNIVRLFQPTGLATVESNPLGEPAAVRVEMISISPSVISALQSAAPAGVKVYVGGDLQLEGGADLELEGGEILEFGNSL